MRPAVVWGRSSLREVVGRGGKGVADVTRYEVGISMACPAHSIELDAP